MSGPEHAVNPCASVDDLASVLGHSIEPQVVRTRHTSDPPTESFRFQLRRSVTESLPFT